LLNVSATLAAAASFLASGFDNATAIWPHFNVTRI